MRPEGTNDYADVLHPETSTEQVIMNSGETLENTIDTHLAESVTQAHMPQNVGLGSVLNYGIATQSEAEAGASDLKYMIPLRTKQAIDNANTIHVGTSAPSSTNVGWIDTLL